MNSSNANTGFSGVFSSEPMLLPDTLKPVNDIKKITVQTPRFPTSTNQSILSDSGVYYRTDPALVQTTKEKLLGTAAQPVGNLKKLVGYTPIEFSGLALNGVVAFLNTPNISLPADTTDPSYIRIPSGPTVRLLKVTLENLGLEVFSNGIPAPVDVGGATTFNVGTNASATVITPNIFASTVVNTLNNPGGVIVQHGFDSLLNSTIGTTGISAYSAAITPSANDYITIENSAGSSVTGGAPGLRITIWYTQFDL